MEDILFAEKMVLIRYGLQSLMARMQFLLHLMFLHKPQIVGTAIMMQARTPAMTAMTALSLNALSIIDFYLVWVHQPSSC